MPSSPAATTLIFRNKPRRMSEKGGQMPAFHTSGFSEKESEVKS